MKKRDPASIVAAAAQLRQAPPDRAATRRYAEQFDWQSTSDGQVAIFQAAIAARANR